MQVGTVAEVWRYPFKSMVGERVQRCDVGPKGVAGDRGWAVRDEVAGEVRGAKKLPGLLRCRARYLAEPAAERPIPAAEVTFPDGTIVTTDERDDLGRRLSALLGREVTVWPLVDDDAHYRRGRPDPGDPMANLRAMMGFEETDPMPDFSGLPTTLREYAAPPGTYFDCYPLHIVTTASLAEAKRLRPDADHDVRRVRPNFLIDTGPGTSGFAEFEWTGKRLRIGTALVSIVTPAVRCAMPMHEQADLPRDKAVLRTFIEHTKQHFGSYVDVVEPGVVSEGDVVQLLD
ncbi:MAG: MOSC domain-containing protein [Dehalococcoidia bacterium]